jgi:uncharacterized protein (TIGR03382 family)
MSLSALIVFALNTAPAHAAETWTDLVDGVRWLKRQEDGQTIHVVEVDLTTDELALRVTREDEAPISTVDHHWNQEALVTINGDWTHSKPNDPQPVGMSVGDGWPWTTDPPNDAYGEHWSFFACTAEKDCHFDDPGAEEEWRWRWLNVIGGNGDRLMVDGAVTVVGWDTNLRPRSALCLDSTETLMMMILVQGDGATDSLGVTPVELGTLTQELGCHNAMSLDGGGSSDLHIGAYQVNERSPDEPDERTTANHLSVLYREASTWDSDCVDTPNSNRCEDGDLVICQAGQFSELPCSAYGWECEEGSDTAYCVNPDCMNGANESTCVDETVMNSCEYGQAIEFDCFDFYEFTCEDDGATAYCVDTRCEEGGNATWCNSDTTLASCVEGAFTETDCAESGLVCDEAGMSCVMDEEREASDSGAATLDEDIEPVDESSGEAAPEGCSATGRAVGGWMALMFVLTGLSGRRRH